MPPSTPDTHPTHASLEAAWTIVLAASRAAEDAEAANAARAYVASPDGELVATAEDMLRTQSNHAARAYSAQATEGGPTFKLGRADPMAKVDSAIVKKVIFPRIDKDS